ncbi:MAG: hypothetical protein AAB845_00405, partial [Patescibacteria group bacterium]
INNPIFYPLLASEEVNGAAQTREEFTALWERFDEIDVDKQEILSSQEMADKLFELQEKFSLKESELEAISVYLRWYYFDWLSREELITSIEELVSDSEESIRGSITQFILNEVLTMRAEVIVANRLARESQGVAQGQETSVGQVKKLQILQALSQYPNLGNQMISSERIRIKSQPEPVRGSLYNWIKYYRDELGIGQHSTVERGQFLFRSENGKALGALERERVNLILKSLEENLPLEIDTERQEIIFPVISVETSVPPQPPTILPTAAPASQAQVLEAPQPPKMEAPVRLDAQPFVPKPAPLKPAEPTSMAQKFQPSVLPYQKIAIPPQPLSPERIAPSNPGVDVSQMAEQLKREPKPEWIKGVFTKENIPESTPTAPALGTMSFSFNHALPAEQEALVKETPVPKAKLQPQPQVQSPVEPEPTT